MQPVPSLESHSNPRVFARKHDSHPFPTGPGGVTSSPLLYPGNPAPPWTPALQLVKEGYTLCRGREMGLFSAAAGIPARCFLGSTFWPFGPRFCPVLAVFQRRVKSRTRFNDVRVIFPGTSFSRFCCSVHDSARFLVVFSHARSPGHVSTMFG